MPVRPVRPVLQWMALLGLVAVTGCSSSVAQETPASASPLEIRTSAPSAPTPSPPPAAVDAAPVPAVVAPPVKALAKRLDPDVLVVGKATLSPGELTRLRGLSPAGASLTFRAGTVMVGGKPVSAVGVDPSTFRAFTAAGTAEVDAVWQSIARGEVVASHTIAKTLSLELGKDVALAPATGSASTLRLGALATTGLPESDLIVDDATATALGLPLATAMLLTAGTGADPVALADEVRAVTGDGAVVDLLRPPAEDPVAFLTGTKAAKAFGSFSYRYFPDGTIAPDRSWVQANVRTETLPIMGTVTCHRLMLPQLRGALEDVVEAGLSSSLTTYDGCYVPRFIERNPENSISLHTWGIAIDMDAATNYRGIKGTMNPEVVNIFKRWGFRWGGDWKYTDPMHFELGALLDSPRG